MYLAHENRHGVSNYVFTFEDPRKDGYKSSVEENVTLDYDMEAVHQWPEGAARPDACLGRDPNNPKHFKVFRYESDRQAEGFEPVSGRAVVIGSLRELDRLNRLPPDPERTENEPWYAYLDRLDEDLRERRKRNQAPDEPAGTSRDEVAEWVAKRHLMFDNGIREVWYLPSEAPQEEIRLLEVNEQYGLNGSKTEAMSFGLNIDGPEYRLFVADVDGDQLARIKKDAKFLPDGWSLAESKVWSRGA